MRDDGSVKWGSNRAGGEKGVDSKDIQEAMVLEKICSEIPTTSFQEKNEPGSFFHTFTHTAFTEL